MSILVIIISNNYSLIESRDGLSFGKYMNILRIISRRCILSFNPFLSIIYNKLRTMSITLSILSVLITIDSSNKSLRTDTAVLIINY